MKKVMIVFAFVFAIFLKLNSMEVDNQISDALGFSLFYSMENNEQEQIQKLLTFNKDKDLINLEVRNKYGATPLHVASFLGLVDVVELLLQAGASVNARTNRDLTPLHCAIIDFYHYDGFGDYKKIDYHKHTKEHCLIAEILLKSGADVKAKDKDGMTPLYYATGENHSFIIELLIYYRANILVLNNKKQTPFDIAVECKHYRTIVTFIKFNPEIVPAWQREKMVKIIKQIDAGTKISVWDFCQDSVTESKFDTSGISQDLFKAYELYYRQFFR